MLTMYGWLSESPDTNLSGRAVQFMVWSRFKSFAKLIQSSAYFLPETRMMGLPKPLTCYAILTTHECDTQTDRTMDRENSSQTKCSAQQHMVAEVDQGLIKHLAWSHLCLMFSNTHCEFALLMFGRLGIHLNFGVTHAEIPGTERHRSTTRMFHSLRQRCFTTALNIHRFDWCADQH